MYIELTLCVASNWFQIKNCAIWFEKLGSWTWSARKAFSGRPRDVSEMSWCSIAAAIAPAWHLHSTQKLKANLVCKEDEQTKRTMMLHWTLTEKAFLCIQFLWWLIVHMNYVHKCECAFILDSSLMKQDLHKPNTVECLNTPLKPKVCLKMKKRKWNENERKTDELCDRYFQEDGTYQKNVL